MCKIYAIANQKGGVGKTTTTINLGAALASGDHSVLLVDTDAQANCSSGLGCRRKESQPTIYDLLLNGASPAEVILDTDLPHLKLLPSDKRLAGAAVELMHLEDREFLLRRILNGLRDQFEFILIDCPPSLNILTINALVAADGVLVPIQSEYMALEGLSDLLDTVERVRRRFNSGLKISGIVATMYDERTNLSNQILQELEKHFSSKLFKTIIPRNIRLAEAPSFGKPVILYDIRSKGAESYINLAKEMLTHEKKSVG
jgi:chromosome partitioning protein